MALAVLCALASLSPSVSPESPSASIQTVAASALPNDLPAQSALKASDKLVFAHYFPPFPISLDNRDTAADYYAKHYLTPTGENGKHTAYGGYLRDRPLPRAVIAEDDWQYKDMLTEVQRANDSGIDGFTYDILGLSGVHWDRLLLLLRAAHDLDADFKIMLMPDSNGTSTADPTALANAIAGLATGPYADVLHRLDDGRLVVSPFAPERKAVTVNTVSDRGATFWKKMISVLQGQGITTAFVPCFLDYAANVAAYETFSYGYSNWGYRSTAANASLTPRIADAHARGKIWMQPVSLQDTRPRSLVYDEASNSENFRLTWGSAISGGADWIQIPTWNDYAEGTQLSPSVATGWAPLDINSYYLAWFKSGVQPEIKRDVVYLSHRSQPHAALPTGGQTGLMKLRGGSTPARDTVEVLSFLVAPAVIEVTIGGTSQTYTAPAGISARLFPLGVGQVSAKITKSDARVTTVTSPYLVEPRLAVQDLTYHFVSSARTGVTTPPPGEVEPPPVDPPPVDPPPVDPPPVDPPPVDPPPVDPPPVDPPVEPVDPPVEAPPVDPPPVEEPVDPPPVDPPAEEPEPEPPADSTAPSVPQGVTTTAGNARATVTWAAASDDTAVAGYHVYLNGTLAETTTDTSAALTGLSNGMTYAVTVEAFDAIGNTSPASVPVSVSPVAPPVYPDLTVTDLSWTPTSVLTGAAVTFSATVRNSGLAATPAGKAVGVAFAVNGTRVNWSSTSTASLAPGATRILTATGGPAQVATWKPTAAGSHTVTASANYANAFTESNVANNNLVKNLAVSDAPGTGLKGMYYNGTAFNTLALTRVDKTVNFNFGTAAPATAVKADSFSVRWTGRIRATKNETYTFSIKSDDGVRLWVSDKLLISDWVPHSLKTSTGHHRSQGRAVLQHPARVLRHRQDRGRPALLEQPDDDPRRDSPGQPVPPVAHRDDWSDGCAGRAVTGRPRRRPPPGRPAARSSRRARSRHARRVPRAPWRP